MYIDQVNRCVDCKLKYSRVGLVDRAPLGPFLVTVEIGILSESVLWLRLQLTWGPFVGILSNFNYTGWWCASICPLGRSLSMRWSV